MSTKSFLRMAVDLLDEDDLLEQLTVAIQSQVTVVSCTTVHARVVHFSPSTFTLLTTGPLTSGLTSEDADKLICAAAPLVEDYFPNITSRDRKSLLDSRPRLRRYVRDAIDQVTSNGTASTRHLLAVVCVAAVFLANYDNLLHVKPNFSRLYRAINLSRCITLGEMEERYEGKDRSKSSVTAKRRGRRKDRNKEEDRSVEEGSSSRREQGRVTARRLKERTDRSKGGAAARKTRRDSVKITRTYESDEEEEEVGQESDTVTSGVPTRARRKSRRERSVRRQGKTYESEEDSSEPDEREVRDRREERDGNFMSTRRQVRMRDFSIVLNEVVRRHK
jgi:hypothetical protein